jgi:hypothetical protein
MTSNLPILAIPSPATSPREVAHIEHHAHGEPDATVVSLAPRAVLGFAMAGPIFGRAVLTAPTEANVT